MLTQALRQGGVVHVHVALLDQRQQLLDGTFRRGQFGLEPANALAALMLGDLRPNAKENPGHRDQGRGASLIAKRTTEKTGELALPML